MSSFFLLNNGKVFNDNQLLFFCQVRIIYILIKCADFLFKYIGSLI